MSERRGARAGIKMVEWAERVARAGWVGADRQEGRSGAFDLSPWTRVGDRPAHENSHCLTGFMIGTARKLDRGFDGKVGSARCGSRDAKPRMGANSPCAHSMPCPCPALTPWQNHAGLSPPARIRVTFLRSPAGEHGVNPRHSVPVCGSGLRVYPGRASRQD
jgi:hypothetical protein